MNGNGFQIHSNHDQGVAVIGAIGRSGEGNTTWTQISSSLVAQSLPEDAHNNLDHSNHNDVSTTISPICMTEQYTS